MLTIIDGNNFFRRLVETGSDARSVLNNYFQPLQETIVVWDGERGSRRRRAVYPQYKTNRAPIEKDLSLHFNTLVRVLSHCNVVQVFHQEYEGDDVVAMLARDYAAKGRRLHIESTDADFLQIVAEYPTLVSTTAKGKTTAELTKLYKIWVGDQSDKISGIPNFGIKAWENTNLDDLQFLTTVALERGDLIDIGLPKAVKPTVELIRILNEIVSFYPVPLDEVMKNIVLGSPNYQAADTYLKEFFL
jgi:DNA polymerase-1